MPGGFSVIFKQGFDAGHHEILLFETLHWFAEKSIKIPNILPDSESACLLTFKYTLRSSL